MNLRWWLPLLGLLGAGESQADTSLPPAGRSSLNVTEGELLPDAAGAFRVEAPKVRAVLQRTTTQDVALDFTYLGPTAEQLPLGSGELRRQVALKLRAENGCNVVYATWRFSPHNAVVVSLKRNPGQRSSAECGNRGYRNLQPQESAAPPPIREGAHHILRAAFEQAQLSVWIDGVRVWRGVLGPDALGLSGPVGMRTDNVRIAFSLHAPAR